MRKSISIYYDASIDNLVAANSTTTTTNYPDIFVEGDYSFVYKFYDPATTAWDLSNVSSLSLEIGTLGSTALVTADDADFDKSGKATGDITVSVNVSASAFSSDISSLTSKTYYCDIMDTNTSANTVTVIASHPITVRNLVG